MRLSVLVAGLLVVAGCRTMPTVEPVTTVYVVRHAERLDNSNDPPLSAAGTARAEALADSLDRWGQPEAVFSTAFVRTRETARPSTQRAAASLRTYGGTPDAAADARDLAASLRATLRPGHRALVVGHSNTVPVLLNAFDGGTRPDLNHADYDGLYVVTLRDGRATVRRVRYGVDDGVPDPR